MNQASKILRPRHESIQRGESDSARTIFVLTLFSHVLKNKRPKMDHAKIHQADLYSLRHEPSVRGLGIVVTFSVRLGIIFLCMYTGGAIQL